MRSHLHVPCALENVSQHNANAKAPDVQQQCSLGKHAFNSAAIFSEQQRRPSSNWPSRHNAGSGFDPQHLALNHGPGPAGSSHFFRQHANPAPQAPRAHSHHQHANFQNAHHFSGQQPLQAQMHHSPGRPGVNAPQPLHYFHHSSSASQAAATAPFGGVPPALPPAPNYAKLPPPDAIDQKRINECAGIPLISAVYSQRQRAQRKSLHSNQTQQKPAFASPPHTVQRPSQPPSGVSQYSPWSPNFFGPPAFGGASHLAQLAAHAKGPPLLLPGSKAAATNGPLFGNKVPSSAWPNAGAGNFPAPGPHQRWLSRSPPSSLSSPKVADKSRLLRHQNSAPPAFSAAPPGKDHQAQSHQLAHSSTRHSPQGVAMQDDGKMNAKEIGEACLPRIIKPRKRRKKDRKPSAGIMMKLDSEAAHHYPEHQLSSAMAANYYELQASELHQKTPHYSKPALDYSKPAPEQNANSHGLCCFCHSCCESMRSIWDYPLRRSLSDSSATSGSDGTQESSSTNSTSQSSTTSASRKPSSKGDVENFSPITTNSKRAQVVGIIGSQRQSSTAAEAPNEAEMSCKNSFSNYCLSDSNDSGYGDILSGINLAEDLFSTKPMPRESALFPSQRPTNDWLSSESAEHMDPMSLLLLPSTAKTLLNASINELSRKLTENGDHEPEHQGPGKARTAFICDFSSDSGLDSAGSFGRISSSSASNASNPNCDDLIFKFDQMHMSSAPNGPMLEADFSTILDATTPGGDLSLFLDLNNNVLQPSDTAAATLKDPMGLATVLWSDFAKNDCSNKLQLPPMDIGQLQAVFPTIS